MVKEKGSVRFNLQYENRATYGISEISEEESGIQNVLS